MSLSRRSSVRPLGKDDPLAFSNGDAEHAAGSTAVGRRKEKPKPAETWGEIFVAWPKITFCIVVNEFCERFSFYGMKTVLQLYLLNVLKFTGDASTSFFNIFTALCYVTSVLGSILADGYIGKFKTIFFLSIVYAVGQLTLSFASTTGKDNSLHPYLDFAGLAIIALGTGGIKPCVSPFGGDQFEKHEAKMISIFFSVFYFSINAGSLISTFISPLFRAMTCMGLDSCYPLAFGVPAVLMIVATIAFTVGSFWYKKKPPTSNVFGDVWRVCTSAVRNRSSEKKAHWLDHALNGHDCATSAACKKLKRRRHDPTACAQRNFVDDVKSLFKLSVIFVPMPFFWMLYDQQATVWILQALQMDCRLWGHTMLLPDQTQSLNAVLILVLIVVFESVIYPIASKCVRITSLRKMVVGGFIAALAFVASALVQFKVNETLPSVPPNGHAYVSLINSVPGCNVSVQAVGQDHTISVGPWASINATAGSASNWLQVGKQTDLPFQFTYTGQCPSTLPKSPKFNVTDGDIFFIHLSPLGAFASFVASDKPTEGQGDHKLAIIAALSDTNYDKDIAVCRVGAKGTSDEQPCDPKLKADFYTYLQHYGDGGKNTDVVGTFPYATDGGQSGGKFATVFQSKSVRPGVWRVYYVLKNGDTKDDIQVQYTNIEYTIWAQGGVYVLSMTGDMIAPTTQWFLETPDNGLSIMWQFPQIFIITCAEILFSITGNEFSYTQSAPSMKSIVGSFWLLTTFFGDLMIVAITLIPFTNNMAIRFLVYAGLMVVVITVFMVQSIFYQYTEYTGEMAIESDSEDDEEDESVDFGADRRSLVEAERKRELFNGLSHRGSGANKGDQAWDIRL
ncbi:hypothetical protein M3Y99_00099300 [Aphelenchoides fujianensis]|nr:hypothetical protein M3Y99_00099300 [Aphelenchoides fujianensis]